MKSEYIQAISKTADDIFTAHLKLKAVCPQRQGNYWFDPHKLLRLQRLKQVIIDEMIAYLVNVCGVNAVFDPLTQWIHVKIDDDKIVMTPDHCQLILTSRRFSC
jgi:hypothetical protein